MENKTYELCTQCWQEVELENKFIKQECPNCGELIKPCSICTQANCRNCPLEKGEAK